MTGEMIGASKKRTAKDFERNCILGDLRSTGDDKGKRDSPGGIRVGKVIPGPPQQLGCYMRMIAFSKHQITLSQVRNLKRYCRLKQSPLSAKNKKLLSTPALAPLLSFVHQRTHYYLSRFLTRRTRSMLH